MRTPAPRMNRLSKTVATVPAQRRVGRDPPCPARGRRARHAALAPTHDASPGSASRESRHTEPADLLAVSPGARPCHSEPRPGYPGLVLSWKLAEFLRDFGFD